MRVQPQHLDRMNKDADPVLEVDEHGYFRSGI